MTTTSMPSPPLFIFSRTHICIEHEKVPLYYCELTNSSDLYDIRAYIEQVNKDVFLEQNKIGNTDSYDPNSFKQSNSALLKYLNNDSGEKYELKWNGPKYLKYFRLYQTDKVFFLPIRCYSE